MLIEMDVGANVASASAFITAIDLTKNTAATPVQLFLAVQILEAFEFKAAPATHGGQRHALA
jgi:hypothetical protein